MVYPPGSHVSRTYSASEAAGVVDGDDSVSKPVPPWGSRTKRLVMGDVRCEPGRKDRAPFWGVQRSRAIQKPVADGGSVYWEVVNRQ